MSSSNLIQWSGLATVVAAPLLVVAELLSLITAESACSGKTVTAGQDLDAIVNADPMATATTFCIQAGTYSLSQTLAVGTGDKLIGETGITKTAGPAKYAEPVVKVRNAANLSKLVSVSGDNVTLKWLDVAGAVGKYDETKTQATCANWGDIANKCPVAGKGVGIAAGNANGGLLMQYLRVHNNDAVGIGNAKGRVLNSELFSNTENGDFLGFTGAGVKGVTEYEAAFNYVHDEQGNGLWCDRGCDDDPARGANGFWAHDNVLVNNGRAGVRYEDSATTALIENNEIHGNSKGAVKGGVSIRDSQNATVRNNVFGPATIAGVTYPANSDNVAVHAADSGRDDRTDLRNVDIVDNTLNGETIKGCELPHNVVDCRGKTPRHVNPPPRSFCVGWPLEAICRLVARFYNGILDTYFHEKAHFVRADLTQCLRAGEVDVGDAPEDRG
jgi:hypothetical protein